MTLKMLVLKMCLVADGLGGGMIPVKLGVGAKEQP